MAGIDQASGGRGLAFTPWLPLDFCRLSSFTCSDPSPTPPLGGTAVPAGPALTQGTWHPASCQPAASSRPVKQMTQAGLWTETLLIRESQADEFQGFNAWKTPTCCLLTMLPTASSQPEGLTAFSPDLYFGHLAEPVSSEIPQSGIQQMGKSSPITS